MASHGYVYFTVLQDIGPVFFWQELITWRLRAKKIDEL